MSTRDHGRRLFVKSAAAAAPVLALGACGGAEHHARDQRSTKVEDREREEGMPPTEDLMREHGVVARVLLVYEECGRRLRAGEELDLTVLSRAASIVESFVEGYHERMEEDHLFPRMRRAGDHAALARTLETQHERGRDITARISSLTQTGGTGGRDQELVGAIETFSRMYRPHAAREDTVLFPAFREMLSPSELHELGERFEEIEHREFGEHGFEQVVSRVAELERHLGIHDLAQLTPPA